MASGITKRAPPSIWWFAFGYFAFYVPYSASAKALSRGLFPEQELPLAGFSILPVSVMASAVGMVIFITVMGWWKYANHSEVKGRSIPHPTRYTFASGLCTAMIIGTTTIAYTFNGVSIVFVMLLMRGGVLIIAPIVDRVSGRRTRWFSWMGLVLSLAALIVAFSEPPPPGTERSLALPLLCVVDIAIYLASYFIRFRFMSRLAKSSDPDVNKRYFVEEQMVAAPALVVILGIVALVGGLAGVSTGIVGDVQWGFTELWASPMVLHVLGVGLLSQGTGICGSLIFLDSRENTFCVPVNRSSSIVAGVVASFALYFFGGLSMPSTYKLAGAGFIIGAILFLSIPPIIEKNRAKRAA